MIKRIFKYLFIIFILGFIAGIFFSPYGKQDGFTYKCVFGKVEINAPIDSVFKYMGNSEHAQDWSVYVDHITPLNNLDGKVGCTRRCFTSKEETGPTWDEDILIVEENKRRQLSIYDLKDFPMSASHLITEQLYQKIDDNKTELQLVLFFDTTKKEWFDELKMYFAAFKIKSIFDGNLANIKREVELRQK
jgi:hypothetical protein